MFELVKVRTLEQALEKELNMDRRLHGWSRDGVGMDRDDFIDLAYVSKQVPGKTPTEVKQRLAPLKQTYVCVACTGMIQQGE